MTIQDDEGFEGVEFDTPIGSFRAGRSAQDDDYKAARRSVRRRMGFFRHLSTFVTVIAGLLVIDVVTGPEEFWVQWVALVWGVVLGVHLLNVFVFDALLGREAERRMIERELRKRQGSG
jgi:cytochrome c biogenesis protein CcdA